MLSESRSVRAVDAGAALLFAWEAVAHAVDVFGDLLDGAVEARRAQELFDGPAFEESQPRCHLGGERFMLVDGRGCAARR